MVSYMMMYRFRQKMFVLTDRKVLPGKTSTESKTNDMPLGIYN